MFIDTTVRYSCGGYTRGDQCNITCLPGKSLVGSTSITCEDSGSEPLKAQWNLNGNGEPTCQDIPCVDLLAPVQGTITCTTNSNIKTCELICNGQYDYPRDVNTVLTCDIENNVWQPTNRLPDCTDKKFATHMSMVAELEINDGSCTDQTHIDQIKANFMNSLHDTGTWKDACLPGRQCSIERLQVQCSEQVVRKKRHEDFEVRHIYKRQTQKAIITWQFRIDFDLNGMTIEDARFEHEFYLSELALAMENDIYSATFDNAFPGFSLGFYFYQNPAEFVCGVGEFVQFDTGTCQSCAVGSVYNSINDICEECPLGTYHYNSTCVPCDGGKTTLHASSHNISRCVCNTV
ncbi:uncharacterized protein LOC126811612 [Patella vulgata]|uniref:uncharacterized protein LOC126811612 n=1 Tax=Patella vulgata TaxID=6465 RepID=UPI0021800A04|nr:uncharacterized protein LOC126811612 [Patella vulgata]